MKFSKSKNALVIVACAGIILSMAGCAAISGTADSRIMNRVTNGISKDNGSMNENSVPNSSGEAESMNSSGNNSIYSSITEEFSATSEDPFSNASSADSNTPTPQLKNDFTLSGYSVLESQVGYSSFGFKAVYLRSTVNPGSGDYYANFDLVRGSDNAVVFSGKAKYWGTKWQSYWWVADFSEFETSGSYYLRFNGSNKNLQSKKFEVDPQLLTNESIQMVLFDQLDARRSSGKLGWRDSSTDELRELQANVIAIQALCDVYDHYYTKLSTTNKNKLIDNIKFGCDYLAALQEKTSDPMTNGRFRHDLYKTQYSAPLVRNWHDTAYALTALARSYGIIKNFDNTTANNYKTVFELSYKLCVARPYYLDSEFALEVQDGRMGTTKAAKTRYGIISMIWSFPNELRTRDRLTFMKACTEMYKSTKDVQYLTKAKEFGKLVADRQYTDYTKSIDGSFGMFKEFDNNENAFMIDWLQSFGQNLGCIQPTDLEPFIDLIRYDPNGVDTAKWYNVVSTFSNGYIKKTANLTPLGIYPIAAYNDAANGGIKFFQSMSHGANNLYGMMGRNMTIIGNFLNDSSFQLLAQKNLQYVIGLNPGIPNKFEETSWTSCSFIYGLGTVSYKGFYGNGSSYTPPKGSGINGFTAAPQFSDSKISQNPDLPKGIIDQDGDKQFNEDYLPHSMGFMSAVILTETPYELSLSAKNSGSGVVADVSVLASNKVIKTYKTNSAGTVNIKDLPLGKQVNVVINYNGMKISKEFGIIGGGSSVWTVDFAGYVDVRLLAPTGVTADGSDFKIIVTNMGGKTVSVTLNLLADGVSLDKSSFSETLSKGQQKSIIVKIRSNGIVKPYTVLVKASYGGYSSESYGVGLAK